MLVITWTDKNMMFVYSGGRPYALLSLFLVFFGPVFIVDRIASPPTFIIFIYLFI